MPRPSPVVTHLTAADLRGRAPVLPRIARLLRPYRGKITLVLVAVLAAAALQAMVPFLTRAVFDDALFPLDGGGPRLDLLAWPSAACAPSRSWRPSSASCRCG